MGASFPKYHITVINTDGPDRTNWWYHSQYACDEYSAKKFKEHYRKQYKDVTILLTPESGPCGIFTRFPTGYRYWSWTENVSYINDLIDMPRT